MSDAVWRALDEGLAAITDGEGLDDVLARHPELAAELRPLLEAALLAGAGEPLAPVPHPVEMASRARFLARAAELRPARAWWPVTWPRGRARLAAPAVLRAALVIAVFLAGFVTGTYGVVAASAASLPGDPLYGVKRTVEQAQLLLVPDREARVELEREFDARRLSEIQALSAQGRLVRVDFMGVFEGSSGERWVISGITVLVTRERASGLPVEGQSVHVVGLTQADGTVLAERVDVLGPGTAGVPTLVPPTATKPATATPPPTAPPSMVPTSEPAPVPVATHAAPTKTPDDDDDDRSGPSASNTPDAGETDDGNENRDTNGNESDNGSGNDNSNDNENDNSNENEASPSPTEEADHSGPSASKTPEPTKTEDVSDDD